MRPKVPLRFKIVFTVLVAITIASLTAAVIPVPTVEALRHGEFYLGWTPQRRTAIPPPAFPEQDTPTHVEEPPAIGEASEINTGVMKAVVLFNNWWESAVASDVVWREPSGYYAFPDGHAERKTPCEGIEIKLLARCGTAIAWNASRMEKLSNGRKGTGAALIAIAVGYGDHVSDVFGKAPSYDLSACLGGVALQHLPAEFANQVSPGAREYYLDAAGLDRRDLVRSALDTGLSSGYRTCLSVYR